MPQSNAGDDRTALSSGGSEFDGIVRAITMGLGAKGLLEDVDLNVEVQVDTDPSSAESIASRRGAGKVPHIAVGEL